jgi:hypothetical protein
MRADFAHGAEPTEAVKTGFRYGARLVTSAAIIRRVRHEFYCRRSQVAAVDLGTSTAKATRNEKSRAETWQD